MTSSNVTAGERYNLRWNNFFNNLVQVFSDLKQKEQLVDVTLVCEGHQIKAHKVVLAACSDFFMELFKNSNHTHPVIKFYDMQLSNLKHIIQFIYQGEVKVLDVDLEGVLNLGEKFQVKGLSSVKLKHQVGPTGECISPESVKYKVLSQSDFKEATTMKNILKANVPISELVDNSSEPLKKKVKVLDLTNANSEKTVTAALNSFTSTSVGKSVSLLTETPNPNFTSNIRNYSKLTSKEQQSDEKLDPQQQMNYHKLNILNYNEQSQKEIPEQRTPSNIVKDGPDKPNAFIIFSREWRKKLKVEYPTEDFKSISVRLSNLWKSLTSETRESYYTAARQAQLSIPQSKSEL